MSLTDKSEIGVVILAAGKGTRLGCVNQPKVMMEIGSRPILSYILETLLLAGFAKEQVSIVVGFCKEKIIDYFGSGFIYAHQTEQLGTAHAALVGISFLPKKYSQILIINGDDSAFYNQNSLQDFITHHLEGSATLSVLTTETENNIQLGRVIRDGRGNFMKILEKEELTEDQKKIKEINTGTYLVDRLWFEKIFPSMEAINGLGEYGMPSAVKLAKEMRKKVLALKLYDTNSWFGINNKEELEIANKRKYANQ